MISDWELWACAQQVLKHHGDQADARVAERVESLILSGDLDGAVTWQAIGDRMIVLRDEAAGAQSVH